MLIILTKGRLELVDILLLFIFDATTIVCLFGFEEYRAALWNFGLYGFSLSGKGDEFLSSIGDIVLT